MELIEKSLNMGKYRSVEHLIWQNLGFGTCFKPAVVAGVANVVLNADLEAYPSYESLVRFLRCTSFFSLYSGVVMEDS